MAGASALVTAMTTDGWGGIRSWFGRWFGRGHAEAEEQCLVRLDRDRTALADGGGDAAATSATLVNAWAVRLQDLVDMDRTAGEELLEWVRQWQADQPEAARRAAAVNQKAKASGHARITQVGGDQTNIRPEKA
ncbi:hypothetical protein [Streptomyces sp. WM6378]|uniref:hypothetical protein n=1 Tax=Streptomyces sp. WM6378 TaxID=1415557 RepID=UPI00131C382E|nr:hypothetical protein [Streptomyces sp. WM6378]